MVNIKKLPLERLEEMARAGEKVMECYRILQKSNSNVVAEVLRGQGTFFELEHYPKGDVYDSETHSQHYYHSHRSKEHGHFTDLRAVSGVDAIARPAAAAAIRSLNNSCCHLSSPAS